MRTRIPVFCLAMLLVFCAPAPAQTKPSTTSAPARYSVTVPPGFKTITVQGRKALVEPADEAWVTHVLQTLTPTTLPTTMPADILGKLQAGREQLKKQITADLSLPDAGVVDTFLDQSLLPNVKRLDDIKPVLIYLVSTDARVKELIKGGWSDERFYYNRAADSVVERVAPVSTDRATSDILVSSLPPASATQEAKEKFVANSVREAEIGLSGTIAQRAILELEIALANYLAEQMTTPLKLGPEQDWFAIGSAGVLASRYASTLSGYSSDELLRVLTSDRKDNPLRAAMIDLAHPNKDSDMRREAIPYYHDAHRTKATRVVAAWSTRAGSDAIAKVVMEIRKNPPADGPALLKLIQQSSNIDLTPMLAPGQ